MSRRTAREVAMKLTYEKLFGCDDTYNDVLEKSGITELPTDADIEYADGIVKGVSDNIEAIDGKIAEHSRGWSINRMPRVDLSILRNAVYELMFTSDISAAVTINEAVELAKIFCDEKSPGFINGILGNIAKETK